MKKILPFETEVMARTYLASAYILGILQVSRKESLKNWVIGNFLQMCIHKVGTDTLLDYYVPQARYETGGVIANRLFLPSEVAFDSGQMINFIKDAIDHEEYVVAYLNEYYVPNKRAYHRYHFDHPILLFGYDTEEEIIHTVGYQRNELYQTYPVSFGDIHNAIQNKNGIFYLLFLKDPGREYTFNFEKAKGLLDDFIHSRDTSGKGEHTYWGINACKEFFKSPFIMRGPNKQIDLRAMHFFWEHANILKCLLEFLHKSYSLEKYVVLEEKISQILLIIRDLKNTILKYNVLKKEELYEKTIIKGESFLGREKEFVCELLKEMEKIQDGLRNM